MTYTRLNPKYKLTELLSFGTYGTVGTSYALQDSMANYDLIVIRSGYDTNLTTGGGAHFDTFPVAITNVTGGSMIEISYQLNNAFQYISVQLLGTSIKITGASSNGKVRAVYGIKFS